MYLQKLKNISSTTRNLSLPNYLKNSNNKNFFFFEKKKHLTKGRNNSGQIIIFSKKKKLNNYLIHNSYLSWSKQTALVINFKQFFLKNLFYLLKYPNGSLAIKKSIFGVFVGDYLNFFFFFYSSYKYKFIGWECFIFFLPRFTFISNIKVYYFKDSFFCTSNGSYLQIIENFQDLKLIKIKLPSGKKKIFNENTVGTIGRNNNIFQKYSFLGSWKFNKFLEHKFNVRGVAMNPVDHPHGGRTKTNKPEVSPWNWVTKHSH